MLKMILLSSVSAADTQFLDTQTSFTVQTINTWQSPTLEKIPHDFYDVVLNITYILGEH
jgi:hypothetical protein